MSKKAELEAELEDAKIKHRIAVLKYETDKVTDMHEKLKREKGDTIPEDTELGEHSEESTESAEPDASEA